MSLLDCTQLPSVQLPFRVICFFDVIFRLFPAFAKEFWVIEPSFEVTFTVELLAIPA